MGEQAKGASTAPSASGSVGDRQMAGFQLLMELGRGAHSVVYRVRRTGGDAEFALKILESAPADLEPALIAFRREAALLSMVDHPGLPRIHEVGESAGRPYMVMDLVEGRSLAALLTGGPLSPDQVIALGLDVVGPLAAWHRQGQIHRDLKPANIMVQADRTARLIDFGFTARLDSDQATAAGTLAYCAPEQSGMLHRPVDHRSDLYSLGVVLFESLAGTGPFPVAEVGELLRMHAVTRPPDLFELVPGTPRGLAEIIAILLAKDPDDRYQGAEELAADLRTLAADPTARPGPVRSRLTVSQPLIGRSAEVAALREWRESALVQGGGVCLIRGPGGGGKSRLADDLANHAATAGALVLRAKSSPDDTNPFAAIRAALENHLQMLSRLPVDEREREHDQLRAACAAGTEGLIANLTPLLAVVLSRSGSDREGSVEPGDNRIQPDQRDPFVNALALFLAALPGPGHELLMLVDDVQWLDDGSRRVLAMLAAEPEVAGGRAVLLVTTGRDDNNSIVATESFTAIARGATDLLLTVAPLDESGVAELVEGLVPGLGTMTALVALLDTRCHGNTFAIQEYLRAVVDAGLLRPCWGTWLLDEHGLQSLDLPRNVLDLVINRVDNLGPQARQVLVVGAVIGHRFATDLVMQVQPADAGAMGDILSEALGHQLLVPSDGGYVFAHDRVREALLSGLDADATADLHAKVAAAMAASPALDDQGDEGIFALAGHYLRSRLGSTPEAKSAFAACHQAGELAMANHSSGRAAEFLTGALGFGVQPDAEFLLLLGRTLNRNGRWKEAHSHLESALTMVELPLLRAEIQLAIAESHRGGGNLKPCLAAVEGGLRELAAKPPSNPFLLALSTAVVFVTATAMWRTRLGFGAADGAGRRRCELIAQLHRCGGYVALIDMRPGDLLVHTLRSLFWTARLGPGRTFVLNQADYGLLCALLGRSRAARLAFDRALADPCVRLPEIRAAVAFSQAVSVFFSAADNGKMLALAIKEHGRWLEVGDYLDGLSLLNVSACVEGRTVEAQQWLDLGLRRRGTGSKVNSFFLTEVMTPAAQGRPGAAGAALRQLRDSFARQPARALTAMELVATFFVLVEQEDFGAPFDAAVIEFDALGLPASGTLRACRSISFHIAVGRIAQARKATAQERPTRLRVAVAAVRALEKTEKSGTNDVLKAWASLARADLQILQGEPQQALATLDGIAVWYDMDAPAFTFQQARLRARALVALEAGPQAERWARMTISIAEQEGWAHKVRSVAAEFAITPTESRTSAHTVSNPSGPAAPTGGIDRQRLQALEQVSVAATRVLDPGTLARIALDETIRILGAERAFLFLLDEGHGSNRRQEDRPALVPYLGRDTNGGDVEELTGYSASLVHRVRDTGEAMVVTGTDEGAALGAQSMSLHGLRSIMVAPLKLDGRLLGVVYLDSQIAKGIFTGDDVGILTALMNHIATSLETARAAQLEVSVQTARRQRDLADSLRESLQAMNQTLDKALVVRQLLLAAFTVLHCDGAWLLRSEPDGRCVIVWVEDSGAVAADGAGTGLAHRIVDIDEPLRSLLAVHEPLVGSVATVPDALGGDLSAATSWIAVPILTQVGGRAVLVLASVATDSNLGEEIAVAAVLAAQAVTAVDKADLFAKVEALAVTDELTGIANRRHFFEVAERDIAAARRGARQMTGMMIDIDHFKLVNDAHGHGTGDDVIRTVAERLAVHVRSSDLLGRYGGEEFALLLHDVAPPDGLPERLRAAIADVPIPTRSGPLNITVSIGLAYLDSGGTGIENLLSAADAALYRAKADGRDCIRMAA